MGMKYFADGCGIVPETGIIGCQASPCAKDHPPYLCPACGIPLLLATISVKTDKTCVHIGCPGKLEDALAPAAETAPKAKRARKGKTEPASEQTVRGPQPGDEIRVSNDDPMSRVLVVPPPIVIVAPLEPAAEDTTPVPIIKALSLSRPWPWAIFRLAPDKAKGVENRDKRLAELLAYPFVALHAAQSWDAEGAEMIARVTGRKVPPDAEHPVGIIGTVHFTQIVERMSFEGHAHARNPWFKGPWGHFFDKVQLLAEPVACKGWPGAFKLTDGQARKVLAQIKR